MLMRVALIFLSGKLAPVVLVSLAARVIVVLSVIGTWNARCIPEGRYYDISTTCKHGRRGAQSDAMQKLCGSGLFDGWRDPANRQVLDFPCADKKTPGCIRSLAFFR